MADSKKSTSSKSSDSSKDETTVKQMSATGGSPEGPVDQGTGPTQDSLNPAFAPPKEDDDDKK